MSASLRALLERRKTYRDLLVTPRLDDALVQSAGNLLLSDAAAKQMQEELTKPGRVRSGSFSGSSRGTCQRAQAFQYYGVPALRTTNIDLFLKFLDGTIRHMTLLTLLWDVGILTHTEIPVEHKRLSLKGTMDGQNIDEAWGFELKTTIMFRQALIEPFHSHELQIGSYFLARPDLQKFSLMYWDTASRKTYEYVYDRDTNGVLLIDEARDELDRMNRNVRLGTMPPVLKECSNGKGQAFRDCAWSHVCLGCRSVEDAKALSVQQVPSPTVLRRRRSGNDSGTQGRTRSVRKRPPRKD